MTKKRDKNNSLNINLLSLFIKEEKNEIKIKV